MAGKIQNHRMELDVFSLNGLAIDHVNDVTCFSEAHVHLFNFFLAQKSMRCILYCIFAGKLMSEKINCNGFITKMTFWII